MLFYLNSDNQGDLDAYISSSDFIYNINVSYLAIQLNKLPAEGSIKLSTNPLRLDLIADNLYQSFTSENLWWVLMIYNNIDDPSALKLGDTLFYPSYLDVIGLISLASEIPTRRQVSTASNVSRFKFTELENIINPETRVTGLTPSAELIAKDFSRSVKSILAGENIPPYSIVTLEIKDITFEGIEDTASGDIFVARPANIYKNEAKVSTIIEPEAILGITGNRSYSQGDITAVYDNVRIQSKDWVFPTSEELFLAGYNNIVPSSELTAEAAKIKIGYASDDSNSVILFSTQAEGTDYGFLNSRLGSEIENTNE